MKNEEGFLGIIIQTYEKELAKKPSADSVKVLLTKSIDDLRQVPSLVKKSTEKFPGSKYDFASRPEEMNSRTKKDQTKSNAALEKMGISVKPESGGLAVSVNLGTPEGSSSEFSDYMERCFGCDTRLGFDFQLMPPEIDFMDKLQALLDQIMALLEQLKRRFESNKIVEQLCAIGNMFGGIPCPQDLITLLLAFKMLLTKYMTAALKIRLDWFSLLGLVVQGIVQIINLIVNMIFDIMVAPLNCTIAVMQSGLAVIRAYDPITFATGVVKANGNAPVSSFFDISGAKIDNTGINSAVLASSYTDSNGNFKTTKFETNIDTSSFSAFETSLSFDPRTEQLLIPGSAGADIKIPNLGALMSTESWESSLIDLSYPEMLVAGVVEARDWILNLKKKIQAAVNSLVGLTNSGKLLEIQSLTVALYLIDMIALIISLLTVDWKNLCSEEKNKEALEKVLKDITGNQRTSVTLDPTTNTATAEITDEAGFTKTVVLNSCTMAKNAVDLSQLEGILSSIDKIG